MEPEALVGETSNGLGAGRQSGHIMESAAYRGFYALCLALSVFLDVIVVVVIVYLFKAKGKGSVTSPAKHAAMLACCIVQMLAALFPYSLHLHLNGRRVSGYPLPCFALVTASVAVSVLDTLTLLVIAVVTLAETFSRGFLVAASRKMQMVYTMALLILAIVYSLAFVVPIFFLVTLDNLDHPCVSRFDDMSSTELYFNRDSSARRALPTVKFLIPFLLLITAQFLLKLTEFVRPRYTLVHTDHTSTAETAPAGVTLTPNDAERADVTEDDRDATTPLVRKTSDVRVRISEPDHSAELDSPIRSNGSPSNAADTDDDATTEVGGEEASVAVNLRLAGLLASAFYFLEFFLMFAYWDLVGEPDLSNVVYWRLTEASEFLKVLVLLAVPLCWLMDEGVRTVVRRILRFRRK